MTREADFDRLAKIVIDEFKNVHNRFDAIEERFNTVDSSFAHLHAELASIVRQLDVLEDAVGSLKGFAKEIDDIRDRVRDIEKHLGINKKIAA